VSVNNSDKENLDKDKMRTVKVFEEPKKFRWTCSACGHANRQDAHKDDGSAKSELKCWACTMTIKFSDEQKVWYILNV